MTALVAALIGVMFTADAMGMMHPRLGRFMQQDPNGQHGGPSIALNGFVERDSFDPYVQYSDGMSLNAAHFVLNGNMDPLGLYKFRYKGKWTKHKSDRVSSVLRRMESRLSELRQQISATLSSMDPCLKGSDYEKMLNDLDALLDEMQKGFAGNDPINLFTEDFGKKDNNNGVEGDAKHDVGGLLYKPRIRLNEGLVDASGKNVSWINRNNRFLLRLLFHELTHVQWDTKDGPPDAKGTLDDAHLLDDLMLQDLDQWTPGNLEKRQSARKNGCPCVGNA